MVEVTRMVEQPDRFIVNAELTPRKNVAELVKRPEAARQSDEGLTPIRHSRFALVHALDDLELRQSIVGDLGACQSARYDANDVAAGFQRCIGEYAHQSDSPAAVHYSISRSNDGLGDVAHHRRQGVVRSQAAAAENANTPLHRARRWAVEHYAPAESGRMPRDRRLQPRPAAPDDGVIRVMRMRRRASTVSVVTGLRTTEMDEVAKLLKRHCGTGGTAKNGAVEIQGDHREKIAAWFAAQGRSVKLAGG